VCGAPAYRLLPPFTGGCFTSIYTAARPRAAYVRPRTPRLPPGTRDARYMRCPVHKVRFMAQYIRCVGRRVSAVAASRPAANCRHARPRRRLWSLQTCGLQTCAAPPAPMELCGARGVYIRLAAHIMRTRPACRLRAPLRAPYAHVPISSTSRIRGSVTARCNLGAISAGAALSARPRRSACRPASGRSALRHVTLRPCVSATAPMCVCHCAHVCLPLRPCVSATAPMCVYHCAHVCLPLRPCVSATAPMCVCHCAHVCLPLRLSVYVRPCACVRVCVGARMCLCLPHTVSSVHVRGYGKGGGREGEEGRKGRKGGGVWCT
jgi:hypothetical protein